MNPSEFRKNIGKILQSIDSAAAEVEKGNNPDFYRALIKQRAIDLFNVSLSVDNAHVVSVQETKTPKAEIIVKEETVLKPEPVIETIAVQKTEASEKIEIPANPVIETPPVKKSFSLNIGEDDEAPIKSKETAQEKPNITIPEFKSKPLSSKIETEELSVNDKISKIRQPQTNYAEKSKEVPIEDLSKAIAIGKKFEFINGLFNGNGDKYKSCLHTIQNSATYEDAMSFVETNFASSEEWEENEKLAAEFFALIRRRFIR